MKKYGKKSQYKDEISYWCPECNGFHFYYSKMGKKHYKNRITYRMVKEQHKEE